MNATHVHLILNHFPIVGTIIALVIMLWALYKANQTGVRIALITWLFMAMIAIPVFLTGEPAEESVEHLAGISEATIEAHEEAAELAIWLIETLGVISLLSLVFGFLGRGTVFLNRLALILGFSTVIAMSYTGYIGGQIRHTELSSQQVGQGAENSSQAVEPEEVED